MERGPKVFEKTLYEVWKHKNFERELTTVEGDKVSVLDVGVENTDTGGPDFKNARIRIGNFVYVGDVEIDSELSDWKTHGHSINTKYNKVILHLSLFNRSNQAFVYTKEGRKIPTVCLNNFIRTENLRNHDNGEEHLDGDYARTRLKCSDECDTVEDKIKSGFVYDLGISRFNKKCDRFFQRLKELAYLRELNLKEPVIQYDLSQGFLDRNFTYEDFRIKELWEQIFYEYIFEALGYSKNKNIMLSLSQALSVGHIRQLLSGSEELQKIHSILFNVAGLMPENLSSSDREITDYFQALKCHWSVMGPNYDGRSFDESQWHFFKLRPQNFPTIRLAGGAVFLRRIMYDDFIGTVIKKFTEIRNIPTLIKCVKSLFIVKSEGFWRKHYIFDRVSSEDINYFVGGARADEIIINVVLPFVFVYAEVFGKKELTKKAIAVYSAYAQLDDNSIVKFVADSLAMKDAWKRSVLSQGMIELFRNYCSKGRCLECQIGKAVFE